MVFEPHFGRIAISLSTSREVKKKKYHETAQGKKNPQKNPKDRYRPASGNHQAPELQRALLSHLVWVFLRGLI